MSRIRHFVWSVQSEARNSSADENARTAKPNSRSRSGSDSRTDSSSSTTDTSEGVVVIDFSGRTCRAAAYITSANLQRRWSEEIDGTLREGRRHQSEQRMNNLDVSFSIEILSLRHSVSAACATTLNGVYSTLVLVRR